MVAGFHGGAFDDLMIVTAFDQETEDRWSEHFRMGNLKAIERNVLTAEEIEIKNAGVHSYTNYTPPNCVMTPEGARAFNRCFDKVLSPNYVAIPSISAAIASLI